MLLTAVPRLTTTIGGRFSALLDAPSFTNQNLAHHDFYKCYNVECFLFVCFTWTSKKNVCVLDVSCKCSFQVIPLVLEKNSLRFYSTFPATAAGMLDERWGSGSGSFILTRFICQTVLLPVA